MTNDQTVTQALEPCPFCGAEDIRTMVGVGDGDRGYSMLCGGCGIRQGSAGRTKEQAITAWNTRTAHSAVATCKFNICDGSGTFYDKVDGECRCTCHSGEGRSNGAGEDAADNFRECVAAELAPARDWYAKGQNHEGVLIYLLTNVVADLQSYRSGTYRSGGGTIAVGEVDPEELEDVIDDAISDSFDEEWTSRHGARHVVGAIAHEGWVVAPRVALSAHQGEVDWAFIRECVEEARSDHVGYHESNKPGEPYTSKYDAALNALAALAQPEEGGER